MENNQPPAPNNPNPVNPQPANTAPPTQPTQPTQPAQTEPITEPPPQPNPTQPVTQPTVQPPLQQTQVINNQAIPQAPSQNLPPAAANNQQQVPVDQPLTQPIANPAPAQFNNQAAIPTQTPQQSQAQPTQPDQNNQNSESENNQTESVTKKQKVTYFLVGLLFNIAAIIPLGLWLIFKVKENKKPRFLSYVLGLLAAILLMVLGDLVLAPLVKQQLIKKWPEMGYIPESLAADYPEAEFNIGLEYNQEMTNGEWDKHSSLTVNIQSDQEMTANDIKAIGEKSCDLLELNDDQYDAVVVQQGESGGFLFFSYDVTHVAGAASCQDWREKSADELVFSIPSPTEVIQLFAK